MIGIVIVFGIASAAFLQINSTQQSFVTSSVNVNKMISDRNDQRLNFTIMPITPNGYNVTAKNISSKTIYLVSYLWVNTTNGIAGIHKADYLDEKNFTTPGKSLNINITSTQDSTTDKYIILVTDLGKKCLVPIGVNFRVC